MMLPCQKPLLWMSLIIMGASILMRDASAVSFPRRQLDGNCSCDTPCGNPCGYPSPPPPSPPVLEPPPPPSSPSLPPAGPLPPFCPPPPQQPYIPAPPYWLAPPAELYPVDPGYHVNGVGRSSIGWLPVLVSCGMLALWLSEWAVGAKYVEY